MRLVKIVKNQDLAVEDKMKPKKKKEIQDLVAEKTNFAHVDVL
jgi:hypothetical protein